MNALQERLAACFAAVFPNRSGEELLLLQRDAMPEWDSLASITLLSVVQEEFQVEIDLFDLDELGSFPLLLQYVAEHQPVDGGGNGG